MTTLTPTDIERDLLRLCAHLEARTSDLAELLMASAEAEHAHKVERARSLLIADGKTAEIRGAQADHATEHLLHARLTATAEADACREAIRSTRAQIDAVRSMGTSLRSAMEIV